MSYNESKGRIAGMNLNEVRVAGHTGSDPKIFDKNESNPMTLFLFSVATDEVKAGEEVTTWHSISYRTSSEKEAEYLRTNLGKGSLVYVVGKLHVTERAHREFPVTVKHHTIEATSIQVIVSKQADQQDRTPPPQDRGEQPPRNSNTYRSAPPPVQSQSPQSSSMPPAPPAPPAPTQHAVQPPAPPPPQQQQYAAAPVARAPVMNF